MVNIDFKTMVALLGAIASVTAIVLGIARFIHWPRTKGRNPFSITVKHIKTVKDPDLSAALRLYDERIEDPDQKNGQDDIVRWLEEAKTARRRKTLREDFLVAKQGARVVGGLYTGLSRWQLLFVSYIFIKRAPADLEGKITFHLVRSLPQSYKSEDQELVQQLFGYMRQKVAGRGRRTRMDGSPFSVRWQNSWALMLSR